MGFKARRSYQLQLPDQLVGLEVMVRGRSMGEYLVGRDLSWEKDPELSREDKAQHYRDLYDEFISDVTGWNLEDEEGIPVSISVEAFQGLDEEIMIPVVSAWVNRRIKLPDPLSDSSTSGDPSVVAQIPMETSSESQAS
jgi:hypothetical protein